jgi:glycosyltransferase involved in cell wall biosynthesis
LRVCHLGKYYPPAPGGMESHVRTLAQAQAALGASVQVICVNHAARDDITGATVPFPTATLQEMDGPIPLTRVGRSSSVARLDICRDLPQVIYGLRQARLDILHLHTPNPAMLLALAMLRRVPRLVITHHSDVIKQKLLRWAIRPFERALYGKARTILTTSAAYSTGSALLQRYHSRVEPLSLGVDLAPYLRASTKALAHAGYLRARYGGLIWLAVGRLVYYKGLHVALEALTRVPGTLLVIGTGPLQAELRRQAEELGVAERVVWQGYAGPEELAGAYHAATAFWFPSNARSEGFGLVQVEAMASGCPVINTAIPASGVSFVSLHEQTGLTIPVNDSAALAGAAQRLLWEPGLRNRLSAAARLRACEEFDHRTMAKRSLEIYERAIAAEPCPALPGQQSARGNLLVG